MCTGKSGKLKVSIQPQRYIVTQEGETVTFKCYYSGTNNHVEWLFNDDPVLPRNVVTNDTQITVSQYIIQLMTGHSVLTTFGYDRFPGLPLKTLVTILVSYRWRVSLWDNRHLN